MSDATVIGVDIGTTSTKVVAFDGAGTRRAEAERGYPLDQPSHGQAVQAPDLIRGAVVAALRSVVVDVRGQGLDIAAVSFSSAMHSLIGLDAGGRPLTPVVTWADTRATEQAERLRRGPEALILHQRSGTPVHPMSPLVKLLWFREQQPALFAEVMVWLGIKEYVIAHLCGDLVMDISLASGTGLLDLASLSWSTEALALVGISAQQLPTLVPTTHRLPLRPAIATELDLVGVPMVVGAGDGPLANLGLGAVSPGVAACSIGTSGALRVMVVHPGVDPLGRVFCYALSDDLWAVGGAISNGGVVLDWAARTLAPDLPVGDRAAILALAAAAPAGSDGLLMLPYLLSERAPHWSAVAQGAYIGLHRSHRREHLVRAALEGVCQQLALVLRAVADAGHEVREIRATGGFLRDAFTRQLLTDVLGRAIGFAEATEGSAYGAALLGMQAVGLIESLGVAAESIAVSRRTRPNPDSAARYAQQRDVFDRLYNALEPTFRALAAGS